MILYLNQFLSSKFNNSSEVLNQVKSIYVQTAANSNFPYIYVGDFHSKNISTKNTEAAEIYFKVTIYSRDKNIKSMLKLTSEIRKLLHIDGENKIVLIRYLSEVVHLQNDGITQQIIMNFRAIISEGANNV